MPAQNSYTGVILAGGRGSRMAPFSEKYPKPLLPVCNRPLMEYQIDIMRWLGGPVKHVTGEWQLGALHKIESEDVVNAVIDFPAGIRTRGVQIKNPFVAKEFAEGNINHLIERELRPAV